MRGFRRHERAHLREDRDQRVLAQEGRLARHVGPGDQPDAAGLRVFRRRQIAIIGDERRAVARQRLLDHRMAAAFDDETMTVVDVRPRVIALGGKMRERAGDIEAAERLGAFLDRGALRDDAGSEPLENLEFEPERAVGGAGDLGFQFAQFGGGEAHLAGQRLAVDEGRVERRGQQLVAVLGGDLDEIAEHVVVPDLERADAGFLGIARLQGGDHAAGFVAQRARLVEARVVAFAHEAAVALEGGQFGGERRGKFGGQHAVRAAAGLQRVGDFRRHILERAPSARARSAAASTPSRMAARSRGPPRPTARRASARARSGEACRRERVSARAAPSSTKLATASSRRAIAAGSVSGADSLCASSREPAEVTRAVDRFEQRAAPLAGQACASVRDCRASPGRSPWSRRRFRATAATAADACRSACARHR